jgi:hypothetical protein
MVDIPMDIGSKMVYFLTFADAYVFAYNRVHALGFDYRFLTLGEALGWLSMYPMVDIAQGPSAFDNIRIHQQHFMLQTAMVFTNENAMLQAPGVESQ